MKKSRIVRLVLRKNSRKVAIVFLLLYVVIAIGYYFLPWSVRKKVYKRLPTVDRILRKNGFYMMREWDKLALFGRDIEVPVDISLCGTRFYAGCPIQKKRTFGHVKILKNIGYTVGYSEKMKAPLWAAYRLFDVKHLKIGPRARFSVDFRTTAQVCQDAYTRSGYDRGHMAPNYGIATRYGTKAQKETFLMSNIIPQSPQVNQRIWADIEYEAATHYGRYFGEVWVITGPIFKKPVKKLSSGVAVPSYYYKIITDEKDGELRVMAFCVAKNCPPYTRIKSCLVGVDYIEELTGLDFFPDLSPELQEKLESKPATRLWPTLIPAVKYLF